MAIPAHAVIQTLLSEVWRLREELAQEGQRYKEMLHSRARARKSAEERLLVRLDKYGRISQRKLAVAARKLERQHRQSEEQPNFFRDSNKPIKIRSYLEIKQLWG
jgi:hypothetical protein